ncbi:hypothetical protein QQF64_017137 [Cirrhinus molitorella]|uniref:non-specific serine/threonine protein kinase n=1 Tax=Cirrhinus molitorella TaxID=172907 RepID=A0ABR3LL32_9TELE
MGQRISRVTPVNDGEVYDYHRSTPPKPDTDKAEQHPHPRDEPPVDAGEGGAQREEELEKEEELEVWREEARREAWSEVVEVKKRKKRFWRLPSFLRAARKHLRMNCPENIISHYELGDRLGVGGFGVVHEARRVEDGLKVAVEDIMKTRIWNILLFQQGPSAPGIIKLPDWQDQRDSYIMVLECPSPCENLVRFLEGQGGRVNEGLVRHIMRQATQAARTCCRHRVFHGNIKLENFIVSKDTLQVKLIDFGCGDLMRKSAYTILYGTMEYYPPEYRVKGKYHARSAMSCSLGVILFTMLCGRFPTGEDLLKTELNLWPPYKSWSSNPRHLPSLLSALRLAGRLSIPP